MQRSDFNFHLPSELIAHYPLAERTGSRLLCLDGATGNLEHHQFTDLPTLLRAGDLLVFNDTRVIPARLWGRKATGGRLEILIERVVSSREVLAHVRASKSPKSGTTIELLRSPDAQSVEATMLVLGRSGELFHLSLSAGEGSAEGGSEDVPGLLRRIGHMPLPPYIEREDQALDRERYQTVYARHEGAVAAPTAGLHFSDTFIRDCEAAGIETGFVTLHVGAGTFQPVRVDEIENHVMHSEYLEVGAGLCEQIVATHARGGRVIAVGTTVVRSLESAAASGLLEPFAGDSTIFIYPGFHFRVVDAMITNFHLPESTLIMLVSAFAGREAVLRAYQTAVEEQYRFFSYGDAMFVLPMAAARA